MSASNVQTAHYKASYASSCFQTVVRLYFTHQVVWHSMQDEFIRQYKHFEDLIGRCYPGSGITMEFTIQDMLEYFSSIAQSH